MNRRRISWRSLSTTRIYQKQKRFYLFSNEAIINPRTGKAAKWHSLCLVDEGEEKAGKIANAIQKYNFRTTGGNMSPYLMEYRLALLKQRENNKPKESVRIRLWESGNRELCRLIDQIAFAFEEFNVTQVMPVDVARFVDQWQARRMAQVYLSRLSNFFRWCARRGLRIDNPCTLINVEKPKARDRYITDREYHRIRDALLIGKDGRETSSGAMVQCYVDLCYLLYQHTTEIRLLRWEQVSHEGVYFKPTKTETSSAAKVLIPLTPTLKAVLARACELRVDTTIAYIIHTRGGRPFTYSGAQTAWKRARTRARETYEQQCRQAGTVPDPHFLMDCHFHDLRAKALTDKQRIEGSNAAQQLAGHTTAQMTAHYTKAREIESVKPVALKTSS